MRKKDMERTHCYLLVLVVIWKPGGCSRRVPHVHRPAGLHAAPKGRHDPPPETEIEPMRWLLVLAAIVLPGISTAQPSAGISQPDLDALSRELGSPPPPLAGEGTFSRTMILAMQFEACAGGEDPELRGKVQALQRQIFDRFARQNPPAAASYFAWGLRAAVQHQHARLILFGQAAGFCAGSPAGLADLERRLPE